MVKTIGVYKIPAWALPALVNKDTSGLSESEEFALLDFVNEFETKYEKVIYIPLGEAYFSNNSNTGRGMYYQVEVVGHQFDISPVWSN
jgi:hypothetical protein